MARRRYIVRSSGTGPGRPGFARWDSFLWLRSLRPTPRETPNLAEEGRNEKSADDDEGDQRRQGTQRVQIRLDDLHGQHRPELERQRVLRGGEHAALELIEREREAEERSAENARPDDREDDLEERAHLARPEIARRLLDPRIEPVQYRQHDQERERQRPDDVDTKQREVTRLHIQDPPPETDPQPEQDPGRHQRQQHRWEEQPRTGQAPPVGKGDDQAEGRGDQPGLDGDDERAHDRITQLRRALTEEALPPMEAEALQRECHAALRSLEGEQCHDDDRTVEEKEDQTEIETETEVEPAPTMDALRPAHQSPSATRP